MIGDSCPGAHILQAVSHLGRLFFVPARCYMRGAQNVQVLIIRRRAVVCTYTMGESDETIKLVNTAKTFHGSTEPHRGSVLSPCTFPRVFSVRIMCSSTIVVVAVYTPIRVIPFSFCVCFWRSHEKRQQQKNERLRQPRYMIRCHETLPSPLPPALLAYTPRNQPKPSAYQQHTPTGLTDWYHETS